MSEAQNRTVRVSLAIGAVLAVAIVLAWAGLVLTGLDASKYRLDVTAVVEGPSQRVSRNHASYAAAKIESWLAGDGLSAKPASNVLPAEFGDGSLTGTWITIVHVAITSPDVRRLLKLRTTVAKASPWPVRDLDRSGQFVKVKLKHGITEWRVAQTLGRGDRRIHTGLQISGPSVIFNAGGIVGLSVVLLTVLSFGAVERNSTDVVAFPRGMHPFAIVSQLIMLAGFACLLIVYAGGRRGLDAGMIVLDAVVVAGVMRWLWVSRSSWRESRFLIGAWRAIAACSGCLGVIALVLATGAA